MAISQLDRRRIELVMTALCEEVPLRVRDQMRHGFTITSTSVELFEERPGFRDRTRWMRAPVAKFRYVASRQLWTLFCQHSDLRWHRYEPLPSAGSFEILLREVRRDPTGIFWG